MPYEKLKYENLFRAWLESRKQNPPRGTIPINIKDDSVPTGFFTPEDMMAALSAFTPYDLYQKLNFSVPRLDYPTMAFNLMNYGNVGIPKAIMLANRPPINRFSPIYSIEQGIQ